MKGRTCRSIEQQAIFPVADSYSLTCLLCDLLLIILLLQWTRYLNAENVHHRHHHHHHRLQPWVGLGILMWTPPATSIPGILQPIATIQFPCLFLFPVKKKSWFKSATSSLTSRVCLQYSLGNSENVQDIVSDCGVLSWPWEVLYTRESRKCVVCDQKPDVFTVKNTLSCHVSCVWDDTVTVYSVLCGLERCISLARGFL